MCSLANITFCFRSHSTHSVSEELDDPDYSPGPGSPPTIHVLDSYKPRHPRGRSGSPRRPSRRPRAARDRGTPARSGGARPVPAPSNM